MSVRIGLLGFGEVARVFAEGFVAGGATVTTYVRNPKPPLSGVRQLTDPAELTAASDAVLSLVTPPNAEAVAKMVAPHLTSRHLYIDFNSVAPESKIGIGNMTEAKGARYAEAAIMGAVPTFGIKAPVILCGPHAAEALALLKRFGFEAEDIGPEPGKASAVKMFRSIIIKGIEALLQECVLGAERYGAADRVLTSLTETYGTIDWNHLASFLIGRSAINGQRRADEMD
ncbi:MAG: NAD(P)-binding domain-containing protein, partial [Proteobacteria bacterium]|nr:NAD(P)-binding domain-containing protein [Pseudomonadota bacterium]